METTTGHREVTTETNRHYVGLGRDDFGIRAAAVFLPVPAIDPLGYFDVVEPTTGVTLEIEVDY